jgi:hypothetical protein
LRKCKAGNTFGEWAVILPVALGAVGLSAWLIHADLPGWANALGNALAGLVVVMMLLATPSRGPFGED